MTDADRCDQCAEHTPGDGWRLCHGCVAQLDATLAGIADAYARLDPRPGARRAGGRAAPGHHSTPSARLDVIILTDPRTRMTAADRWAAATANVLGDWAETLGLEAPRGRVADQAAALRGALDRLAAADWAADAHRSLVAHHRELLRVLGELTPSVVIGPCPVVTTDGLEDEPAGTCGGKIRAEAFGRTATCNRCGATWRGVDEWRALGRTLGPAEMDAAELARYFGHSTTSTVRTWASRDQWPRRRRGGRIVFPLETALATWARIHGAEATH